MEAVLTALADPAAEPPGLDEQVELALRLANGCDKCWTALDELDLPEPHTSDEPIIRAVLRAACPSWGFYLWSRHLRLVRQLEPGVGFADLVAEEAIDLALRREETNDRVSCGLPTKAYLDVAKRLATELAESQWECLPAYEVLARIDTVRAACAPHESTRAAAESAHRHHQRFLMRSPSPPFEQGGSGGIPFRESHETEIALVLADLHVVHADHVLTRYPQGAPVKPPLWMGSDELRRVRDLLAHHDPGNPLRYFEILYEGWKHHRQRSGITERSLLESLDGVEHHPDVLYRLNGLFKKARLVAGLRSRVSEADEYQVLAADTAADLAKARGLVESYGDTQSQALYHQYLGDLLAPDDPVEAMIAYERALEILGEVEWFRRRVEVGIRNIPDTESTGWYRRVVKLAGRSDRSRSLSGARAVTRRVDQGLATVSQAIEDWAETVAPGAPRELSAEFYLAISRLRELTKKLARTLHTTGRDMAWKGIRINAPGEERAHDDSRSHP